MPKARVVSRLRDFEIEEVSVVDHPANKRPFLMRKNDGANMKITKSAVSQVSQALKGPVEKVSTIVSKLRELKGGKLDAATLGLFEGAATVLKGLGDGYDELLKKYENVGFWPSHDDAGTDPLVKLAGLLETLATGVSKLQESALDEQSFAEVIREAMAVGAPLAAIGEELKKAPEAAAPAAETPAAAPAAPTPAVPAAATPAPVAATPAPAAAAASTETPAAETPAVPATETPGATPTTEIPPSEAPTPETPAAPAPAAAEPTEAAKRYIAEFDAISTGLAELAAEPTRDGVEKMGGMCDSVYIRGGISLDTGDMEMLAKIVTALVATMGEVDGVAKSLKGASPAFTELAAVGKALADRVRATGAPGPNELRTLKGVTTLLKALAAKLPQSKAQAAAPDMQALVTAAVAAALAPVQKQGEDLKKAVDKLTAENVALRQETTKRGNTPAAPRASSPETATSQSTPTAVLFPEDYNTDTIQ